MRVRVNKKGSFRRRVIQLLSALIYNLNYSGFAEGKIYKGPVKGVCVPGLNCYSCPGAIGACPLGSLQSALASGSAGTAVYVLGLILVFGALLGRTVCAYLCPFGLIQELLYKLPSPKLKKNRVTRALSYLKYLVLAVFVVLIPLALFAKDGMGVPAFCKFICPAGTLEAGIPLAAANEGIRSALGPMFALKVAALVLIIAASVFVFRAFCRFLCPLGAIYSFFNRFALLGIKVDENKCTRCGACVKSCKMDVRAVNDRECIRCGECRRVCPENAINNTFERVIDPVKKAKKTNK